MKIPNANNLANVKMLVPIIPTIQDETRNCEILIEMTDGTIADYINEGFVELMEKYINMNAFLKSTGLTMEELPSIDKNLTKVIKKSYPDVKNVYRMNL